MLPGDYRHLQLALTGWRIGGWQTLPLPHIAWVGAPPPLPTREFVALAEDDPELEYALAALHDLFSQAPLLGSLMEPSGGDLFEAEKMREIERHLEPMLEKARRAEPERAEGVIAARGMADAAIILNRKYYLQATSVPFVGSSSQGPQLALYFETHYPNSSLNLATVFLERMRRMSRKGGALSGVFTAGWTFQSGATRLRYLITEQDTVEFVVPLGDGAFESASAGEGVCLCCLNVKSRSDQDIAFLTAESARGCAAKGNAVINSEVFLEGG